MAQRQAYTVPLVLAGAVTCVLVGAVSTIRYAPGPAVPWLQVLALVQCSYGLGLGTGFLVWSRRKTKKGEG
ncbi:MAG: hypothetical protein V4579_07595 [Pseudomonadota bacterium]